MSFRELMISVWSFLFNSKGQPLTGEYASLIFVIACGFMGFVMTLLDCVYVSATKRNSFLNLSYATFRSTLLMFVLWGVGAFIGGYIGTAANIVQMNLHACIGIGVGWPFILPRLIESFSKGEYSQKSSERG